MNTRKIFNDSVFNAEGKRVKALVAIIEDALQSSHPVFFKKSILFEKSNSKDKKARISYKEYQIEDIDYHNMKVTTTNGQVFYINSVDIESMVDTLSKKFKKNTNKKLSQLDELEELEEVDELEELEEVDELEELEEL